MAIKATCSVTLSAYRDTQSVTRYYKLQSSTAAAPSKPTTNPPSGWTDTEPSYTSGSTNTLYFCDLTMFSDGTWSYSAVSKSSSYEAAKEAYNKAVNAESRITSAETNINKNTEAIELRATKTEVTETLGGYYTKTEADAAIELSANGITQSVSETYATKTDVNNVQTSVDEAISITNDNQARITSSESEINQLADSISTLVTNENGESMMVQDPTTFKWSFSVGEITNSLNDAKEQINNLSGEVDNVDSLLSNIDSLVNDLSEKTAYIVMTTDDNGDPCIELGKEGNDFRARFTNTSLDFMEGTARIAYVSNQTLYIEKAIVKNELQIGEGSGFIWMKRQNGNMGLRWIEE